MSGKKNISAASIIGKTVTREKWLSIGIVLTVTGAVAISLLPPLVMEIDRITRNSYRYIGIKLGIFHGGGVFSADLPDRGAGVPEREFPHCLWSEDGACVQERALR